MRVEGLFRIALVCTLVVSGLGLAGAMSSAQAGEFYTRKRVKGVWMTGRFAKHHPVKVAQHQPKAPEKAVQGSAAAAPSAAGERPVVSPPRAETKPAVAAVSTAVAAAAIQSPAPGPSLTPVAYSDEDRLLPLRRALEQRAKTMAVAAPAPAASVARTVKAVTYNFDTGLRTSVYSDGTVVEEPFNPDTALTGSIRN